MPIVIGTNMVDRSVVAETSMDNNDTATGMGNSPPPPERLRSRSRGRDQGVDEGEWERIKKNIDTLYTSVLYARKKVMDFGVAQNQMQHILDAANIAFKSIEASSADTAAKNDLLKAEVQAYTGSLEARLQEAEARLTRSGASQ